MTKNNETKTGKQEVKSQETFHEKDGETKQGAIMRVRRMPE